MTFKGTLSKRRIIIASILCFTMLCSWLCGLVLSSKAAGTPIVSGATYFTDTYTGDGKSSVQYATVDLNDASVEPVLLTKSKVTTRGTITSMMDNSKDIIGINGSFYTSVSGVSNAVGIIVDNGVIRSYSPSLNSSKNKFATLCIANDGTASIEYFKPYIAVTSSNGRTYKVNRYNYAYAGGTGISVYDKNFATMSYGNTFDDVYEIVVRQGIMKSLRKNKEPIKIPKKGFVLTASGSGAKKLKRMYVKGGKITLEAYTNADDYVKPTASPVNSTAPSAIAQTTAKATPTTQATTNVNPSATATAIITTTASAIVPVTPTTTPMPTATVATIASPTVSVESMQMMVNVESPATTQTPDVTNYPTSAQPSTTNAHPLATSALVSVSPIATSGVTPVPTNVPAATTAPSFTPVPYTGIPFGDYKICITGGAQLVSNGEALTSFSHLPTGTGVNSRTPKTAIGIGADGKSLILVTVDGRSSNDAGISMKNLATYMTTLGAYNAINLDGGGSTTFVAKLPGEDSPTVKNTPSDGKQRSVINGFGIRCAITSDGVPTNGKISGQTKSLVSVPIKLTMKLWDASLNACPFENSEVTWQMSGVEGTLTEDGIFTANTTGTAEITATYKEFVFTKKVKVHDAPTSWGFNYSPKLLAEAGNKYTVKLKAINDKKKSCYVYGKAVAWNLTGSIGKISKNGKLTVQKSGAAKVTATYDELSHTLPISVCTDKQKMLDKFTSSKKLTYKKTALKVTQSVNKKKKFIKTGSRSLKINYKVKKKQKKARTISLALSGKIPNYTYEVGARVYVPKVKKTANTVVTLYYKNKKNKQRKIVLTETIKKGWNDLIYDSTLSNKCKLSKIVITVKNRKKHSSTLYFDSLYAKYKRYPAVK